MLQLSQTQTREALPFKPLVEALRTMFREGCEMPVRHHHTMEVPDKDDATLLLMPAWQSGAYFGVKLASVFPSNAVQGIPAVSATYLLSDGRNGAPLALVDGGELTARRTAAASALAADYLARKNAKILCMVGTGRLSANLIEAHCTVRQIETVYLWGRNFEKAQACAADLSTKLGLNIIAEQSLEIAVGKSDIISVATLSNDPLVQGQWLPEGCHLDLVGGFTPLMREADETAVSRSRVFVDTKAGAMKEAGDITTPLANGTLKPEDVQADLYELTRGENAGRTSTSEITFFKSVGAALEDLAGAVLAYETAKATLLVD
ncbi:ornithine cyclodeaminase family protein [Pseudovibrio sp. Tun.PSC04-5.I4]|uniref:ornithine cyclodeaminase family protein n=1 Tax=Pseudovibrio sp. Tun.PSC04-5.I4 TaxID=1798213 RepID=UPI00087F8BC1|nr:ornithine cyclodeaminase family protein [Pseudovibrio sp. Tun.PSC04-5.I4]SDR06521.1 ornithine cyclodeaminase [Pseudovibrio sp. Tun.PSC04-5.I4]